MKLGRTMIGNPIAVADCDRLVRGCARIPTPGTSRPISPIAALNSSRSSAVRIASALAPISFTPNSESAPESARCHREVECRLAAERRQDRVGALALDDRRQHLGNQRLDVRAVGDARGRS